jgi:Na+/glutamate symporter
MTTENIAAFISAAGLGGIVGGVVTSVLQSWLSRRAALNERTFREKKEAYVGFLQALSESEIAQTESAAKQVGHWQNICDLVGSAAVRILIAKLFETNPSSDGRPHPDRHRNLIQLKAEMRADLGIENGKRGN